MKKLTKREIKEQYRFLSAIEQVDSNNLVQARQMLLDMVKRYGTFTAAVDAIGLEHKTGLWKTLYFKNESKLGGTIIGSTNVYTYSKWIKMFLELER